jgi:hypothetical protein
LMELLIVGGLGILVLLGIVVALVVVLSGGRKDEPRND